MINKTVCGWGARDEQTGQCLGTGDGPQCNSTAQG